MNNIKGGYMREQLSNLMDLTHEFVGKKQEFDENRRIFNCKVELETKRENIFEYYKKDNMDSYDAAKEFFSIYLNISSVVFYVRKTHPRYGIKRIKNIVSQAIAENEMLDEEIRNNSKQIVDNYMLYENCGFSELRVLDDELTALKSDMEKMGMSIFDETKQMALEASENVVNILKPYKEYSKDKLEEAGIFTKSFISSGKQLVKMFQKMTFDTQNDE